MQKFVNKRIKSFVLTQQVLDYLIHLQGIIKQDNTYITDYIDLT